MRAAGDGIGTMPRGMAMVNDRADSQRRRERQAFIASMILAERMLSGGLLTPAEFESVKRALSVRHGVEKSAILRRN